MSNAKPNYDPSRLEAIRQRTWAERSDFQTPAPAEGQAAVYVKASSPFTSGNLHMGHVRDYSIGDAYARFRRARGDAVLLSFGFDAFGLPAELAAIERKEPPAGWVEQCGERMLDQMRRLGFSVDYDRVFYSSDESQYRWSQWLFLTLLEVGMIHRDEATVDWCDTCQTTLAAIQVEDGRCWRCHNEVRLIRRPTWFLGISRYVEENDGNLPGLEENWDELSLAAQRFITGRNEGAEVTLSSPDGDQLTVFTPHPASVGEADFVLISPRHPEVERWTRGPGVGEELERMRSGGWERSARDAAAVPLLDSGASVVSLDGARLLPVAISAIVDARYGPTAALGISSVDEADEKIAARIGRGAEALPSGEARGPVEPAPTVRYRASDFSISRQRSWGTPIPVIHCEACGAVPVPFEDLPVVLPRDIEPTGEGNPLAERADFVDVECPRCGGEAKRETDTLDCHFDALWLWVPAAVPPEDRAEQMFSHPDLRRWLPAERLVAGGDSGNFVFDQRIVTKALRDIGPFDFLEDGEPFAGCLFHEMVVSEGRKMSKHLGNVVDPDALVEQYGADTVRLAILYAAGPAKTLNWSDSALRFASRFLRNVWTYSHDRFALLEQAPRNEGVAADTEHLRDRLRKWCESGLDRITADYEGLQMHKAVRNVTRLLERIQDYEKRILQRRDRLSHADVEALLAALVLLFQVLAPLAPHLAEQLLIDSGRADGPDLLGRWPSEAAIPVGPADPTPAV